jgi:hypothetical protein
MKFTLPKRCNLGFAFDSHSENHPDKLPTKSAICHPIGFADGKPLSEVAKGDGGWERLRILEIKRLQRLWIAL